MALFQSVLDAFAKSVGAGDHKIVIIVLDNAGWHVSKKVKLTKGIRLCFLPPYSPELLPAERLWPLSDDPAVIKGNTLFYWWPTE